MVLATIFKSKEDLARYIFPIPEHTVRTYAIQSSLHLL
jgi:hypothetical protein